MSFSSTTGNIPVPPSVDEDIEANKKRILGLQATLDRLKHEQKRGLFYSNESSSISIFIIIRRFNCRLLCFQFQFLIFTNQKRIFCRLFFFLFIFFFLSLKFSVFFFFFTGLLSARSANDERGDSPNDATAYFKFSYSTQVSWLFFRTLQSHSRSFSFFRFVIFVFVIHCFTKFEKKVPVASSNENKPSSAYIFEVKNLTTGTDRLVLKSHKEVSLFWLFFFFEFFFFLVFVVFLFPPFTILLFRKVSHISS